MSSENFIHSSFREKVLEHLFISKVLEWFWCNKNYSIEVLRSEVDNGGFDIVLQYNNITRHIQLKTAAKSVVRQNISLRLADRESGCVILICFKQNESGIDLGPYYYFGADPGKPLPNMAGFKTAKSSRANAQGKKKERTGFRTVPIKSFGRPINSIEDLINKLFGI